ncbi:glutamyl-tRNA reductase [Brachybacterium sp. AOP25-B2-12]|uniref:glutamyl-tRNA reductase n=1 Tax=Brachybacterium sp. AOP25-B2-12 TaxID=3457710 RepID=UPI004034036A
MLAALRATHEHLDLGVLDALTRGAEHLDHVIERLNVRAGEAAGEDGPPLAGWAVVSTCNRLEVYLDAHRFHDGVELVAAAVARTSGLEPEHVAMCLETATGAPVAEHLYEVTAGLRSIVIGEAEIAGQIHHAFETSRAAGSTTPMLNDLFQIGFRHAKQVTARTPVGAAGRSGVAIALDRAARELGDLRERSVLIIGTGAYARLAAAELTRRGCRAVHVHSASGRAVDFAARHGIDAVGPGELPGRLHDADLVLACSGRGTSLFPEHFLHAGPTLILDLALHSDLHPLLRHLADVRILNLMDLTVAVDDSAAEPLADAERIVLDGVESFRQKQEFRRIDPAMVALRRSVSEAADAEIAALRRRPDGVAEEVERGIRRILAKVMHSPTARARRLAEEGMADEVVDAFHTIFGIEIADDEDAPTAMGASAGWMRLDRTVPPRLDADAPRRDDAQLEAELARIAAVAPSCPIGVAAVPSTPEVPA